MAYTKGLHQVADGVWAYLQPDGGWGWSNAGLITGGGVSLLVDTLFDLKLTAETLNAAYAANPCRFGNRRPSPPKLPTAAWINKPTIENDAQKKS